MSGSANNRLQTVSGHICPPKARVMRVVVTGAAGQIGYQLCGEIARGDMFGGAVGVALHMLDVEGAVDAMRGVKMELEDGAYPLLKHVLITTDLREAFEGVDYAIMVGAMPRKPGMERSDLLKANVGIFQQQGQALDKWASKNVKVLVVGNPANTNCAIAAHFAPSIPRQNFSALTRLDHNRAISLVARHLQAHVSDVQDVWIWGNHSTTQYPDVSHCLVRGKPALNASTDKFFRGEFISIVQKRGGAIVAARKQSSALSAAQAIVDHIRDWHFGTDSRIVSMAIPSGPYGIPEGVYFSYPVQIDSQGVVHVVQGLSVDAFSKQMLDKTYQELLEEWTAAREFVGAK